MDSRLTLHGRLSHQQHPVPKGFAVPNFKYADHEPRVYDEYGLVLPGRVIERAAAVDIADEDLAPDHRWGLTTDAATDAPPAPPVVVDGNQYAVPTEPEPELAPAPAAKPKTPDVPPVVVETPAPADPPADSAPAA